MRRMQADQHNKAIREHMQTVSDTWRIDRNQLPPWADDTLVFEPCNLELIQALQQCQEDIRQLTEEVKVKSNMVLIYKGQIQSLSVNREEELQNVQDTSEKCTQCLRRQQMNVGQDENKESLRTSRPTVACTDRGIQCHPMGIGCRTLASQTLTVTTIDDNSQTDKLQTESKECQTTDYALMSEACASIDENGKYVQGLEKKRIVLKTKQTQTACVIRERGIQTDSNNVRHKQVQVVIDTDIEKTADELRREVESCNRLVSRMTSTMQKDQHKIKLLQEQLNEGSKLRHDLNTQIQHARKQADTRPVRVVVHRDVQTDPVESDDDHNDDITELARWQMSQFDTKLRQAKDETERLQLLTNKLRHTMHQQAKDLRGVQEIAASVARHCGLNNVTRCGTAYCLQRVTDYINALQSLATPQQKIRASIIAGKKEDSTPDTETSFTPTVSKENGVAESRRSTSAAQLTGACAMSHKMHEDMKLLEDKMAKLQLQTKIVGQNSPKCADNDTPDYSGCEKLTMTNPSFQGNEEMSEHKHTAVGHAVTDNLDKPKSESILAKDGRAGIVRVSINSTISRKHKSRRACNTSTAAKGKESLVDSDCVLTSLESSDLNDTSSSAVKQPGSSKKGHKTSCRIAATFPKSKNENTSTSSSNKIVASAVVKNSGNGNNDNVSNPDKKQSQETSETLTSTNPSTKPSNAASSATCRRKLRATQRSVTPQTPHKNPATTCTQPPGCKDSQTEQPSTQINAHNGVPICPETPSADLQGSRCKSGSSAHVSDVKTVTVPPPPGFHVSVVNQTCHNNSRLPSPGIVDPFSLDAAGYFGVAVRTFTQTDTTSSLPVPVSCMTSVNYPTSTESMRNPFNVSQAPPHLPYQRGSPRQNRRPRSHSMSQQNSNQSIGSESHTDDSTAQCSAESNMSPDHQVQDEAHLNFPLGRLSENRTQSLPCFATPSFSEITMPAGLMPGSFDSSDMDQVSPGCVLTSTSSSTTPKFSFWSIFGIGNNKQ